MCNLSWGIYEKGISDGILKGILQGKAEGILQGKAEGIIKGKLEVVQSLLKRNCPLEEALEIAGIDMETFERFSESEE